MTSFKPIFDATQSALKGDPAAASATFEAASRQLDGLRSEAQARQFNLIIDEPAVLGGTDQGPNPAELVLAALAACQEITYRLYADALGIPLNGVSVKVAGDLDLRGFFAVDDQVRPGFGEIRADVTLDTPASPEAIEQLRAIVNQHCPVLDILRNATPVSTTLTARAPVAAA